MQTNKISENVRIIQNRRTIMSPKLNKNEKSKMYKTICHKASSRDVNWDEKITTSLEAGWINEQNRNEKES